MRLLLFEWLTGGGLWQDNELPDVDSPILQQGIGMLTGLAEDLTSAGIEVVVPLDVRQTTWRIAATRIIHIDSIKNLRESLARESGFADAILLIAPESDGCLEMCCQWLQGYLQKLVSPDLAFIKLTSNKQLTVEWLAHNGVCVPQGKRLSDAGQWWQEVGFPLVIKPLVGAGSEQIQLIKEPVSFVMPPDPENWRVEKFIEGESVSVSVLSGIECRRFLPPTGQLFDGKPFGSYIGAKYPLDENIAHRATILAKKTALALPATKGYFGIDMIISNEGPENDCVIEVNPRLTMSYLKLRKICAENLALQMLKIQCES